MDISIFGYKVNLEILILIGIVYIILVGHTFCGCCRVGLLEGLEVMKGPADATSDGTTKVLEKSGAGMPDIQGTNSPVAPAGGLVSGKAKNGAAKANGKAGKEGFVGANTNFGESSSYDLNKDHPINTSSWFQKDLVVVPGKPLTHGVKEILDRPAGLPLPKGELFMFANTEFKPECCPNTFSTGNGCACMSTQQYNYLIERGGNNIPYSEY
jgi:hypothetical protein